MSSLTFNPLFHPTRPLDRGPGLFGALHREWTLWMAGRAMRRLDDEALHDVGVARGAIDEAVRHGRSARRA